MDSFYQKRLATKEARIQEMRKAHSLLERQARGPSEHHRSYICCGLLSPIMTSCADCFSSNVSLE